MPTYDYECEACGHRFEQVQSMRSSPLRKCPQCGKNRLERLVTGGTGFILKGAGFWKNDSKTKKSGGVSSSSTPAAAAGTDGGKGGDGTATGSEPAAGGADKPEETPGKEGPAAAESPGATIQPAGKKDLAKKPAGGVTDTKKKK